LAPTFAPTFAPTLAKPSNNPILQFTTSGQLHNTSNATLSNIDKQCIAEATAAAMNISKSYVTFVDNDTKQRKLASNININYLTKIAYPLTNKIDANTVYNTLTSALAQSVTSGTFNIILRNIASNLNASNMAYAGITNVSSSTYAVVVQKRKRKTSNTSDIKKFIFFAFLIVTLPLTYLKYKDCNKSKEQYNKRRNYYFSLLYSNNGLSTTPNTV
jgi:hypothetical protein